MKKEGGKKKWIIIIIIIILIIIVIAIVGLFVLKQNNFNFVFNGFDFSNGLEGIGKSGNTFQDTKLNPFVNGTG